MKNSLPPEWTNELKARCCGRCGEVGDPPCWRLPELTSDAVAEEIHPCTACINDDGQEVF